MTARPTDDNAPLDDPIQPSGFTPLGSADTDQAYSPSHLPRLLLAGVAILFAAIMLFLFSARSLHIDVIAQSPADVSVSGFALPFGQRYLLPAGDYQVTASAPGYIDYSGEVTVDDRDSQRIEVALQPLPGRVTIDSTPAGAEVSIDGEVLGKTPLQDISLSAGEHELVLQEARHFTLAQVVEITGRNIEQRLALTMQPAWAPVTIDSTPAGAILFADGEELSQTPATLELLQGKRELLLRHPGFADWRQAIEVSAGEPVDLGRIELLPAPGMLELASEPGGANVTLGGEFQGQTPLLLELSPDQDHQLSVFKPGYRRHTETVRMSAAQTRAHTVTLRALLGAVRVRVSPDNAVVRVDGKVRGRGNQTLSLPAIAQTVEVSLGGYATVRRSITPRPGLEQLVDVTLKTEKEVRMARLPPRQTNSVGLDMVLFTPSDSPLRDFTMGASRRDPGRRSNEALHPVSLRRMFYMATTEVTNAQFRLFQADHKSGQVEGRSLNRDKQPAVQLSWQQAASFCNWLSQKEGLPPFYKEDRGIIVGFNASATGYRLPSEAEWAWVARTRDETMLRFPWGENFPPKDKVENYADSSSAFVTGRVLNNYEDGFVVSAPVASFAANHHGLFDIGGNVAEWVNDVYAIASADGAVQVDPLGTQSGDNYVIRGASWDMAKLPQLRLSYRDYGQAGRDDVGFRIARYAE